MLCHAVRCCAMLCCAVLCCAVPCCAVLCDSVLCRAVMCGAVRCCACFCACLCVLLCGAMCVAVMCGRVCRSAPPVRPSDLSPQSRHRKLLIELRIGAMRTGVCCALALIMFLTTASKVALAGNFACGPYDVCRWTHCGECSKVAPRCNTGEQAGDDPTCSNNCWFSVARKRRCCAQSTCTTRNDAYTNVFEDVPYTMSVLSNDDGKAGLSISSTFTRAAL